MGTNDNTRRVQEVQLELFKVFMDFCEKHNLRYFVAGGALIGVLRHKGYIPWDEDIDVSMPRKDYDKFVSLQDQFPKGYGLTDYRNNPNWHFNFSQFIDEESEIIIHMNELPQKSNVWIDVFPEDGLPSNGFRRWLHMKHILMYRYMIQAANLKTQVKTTLPGRPWHEKIVLRFLHYVPLGKLINTNKTLEKMATSLRKYDYDDCEWVGSLLGRYRDREIVPKSYWGHGQLLPFENLMVMCPEQADKLMTHIYGNYMQLPPENKRDCHHIEILKLR